MKPPPPWKPPPWPPPPWPPRTWIMSSLAAFAAGNAVGLIGVIASARRAAPVDNISVATAASPSKRIGLAPGPNILSIAFSLNPDSGVAPRVPAPRPRCSFTVAPKIKLGTAT
ncbi:hypothetical protein B5V03_10530 [Bradyrhizobium betae]|uniref:Uncharacterized protein n=1 Tax=Bradyrhizobium betae TaxID=244734 RepID=A0A4Q1V9J3_9BRAD|nr:hypothetical protein B5V03_10530 [Bradyrhizobium betae]